MRAADSDDTISDSAPGPKKKAAPKAKASKKGLKIARNPADRVGSGSLGKVAAKAEATRQALVEVAIERLITHSLDGLASLISPSALARASATVSVDTAYRLLESPEAALALVVESSASPNFSAPNIGWSGLNEVSRGGVGAHGGEAVFESAAGAIRHYLEANFSEPALPLGRLLDAAALTASSEWHGEVGIRDERRGLALQILDARRVSHQAIADNMRWIGQDAFAELRRRPKPGMTMDSILQLLLSLADGAIDRMMISPGCMTLDDVVSAIIELAMALSEDGSMSDPRIPENDEGRFVFTTLVAAADKYWSTGASIGTIEEASRMLDKPLETLVVLFPTINHLADSVLRVRTIAGGIDGGAVQTMNVLLGTSLRRLARAADALPEVVKYAGDLSAADSVLNELTLLAASLATAAETTVEPQRLAEQLVSVAAQGTAQIETVELLLEMLRGEGSE